MEKLNSLDIAKRLFADITRNIIEKNVSFTEYLIKSIGYNYNVSVQVEPIEKNLMSKISDSELISQIQGFLLNNITERKKNTFEIYYYLEDFDNCYFLITIKSFKNAKQNCFEIVETVKLSKDQKIINIIIDAGPKGISATELNRETRNDFNIKNDRIKLLNDMIEDDIIFLVYDRSKGRMKKIYKSTMFRVNDE